MHSRPLLIWSSAILALCLGMPSVFAAAPRQATTPAPPPGTVGVTPEVFLSPPGVTARFTVTFPSATAGQGEVYFGSSCDALVEVSTRDRYAGTAQHAVTVVGNDLPGTVGDNGIQPGVTYFFATVTITSSGPVIDNNGGKCYSVTIPTAATRGSTQVLTASLLGSNEVPAGAPGGSGFATITIDTAKNIVCWALSASGITLPAIASHIHKGPAGVAGPVVEPLTPPGTNGTSTGCAAIDPALAQDIIANPSNYYVNVHTTEFPAGAIRGQLGTMRVLTATLFGSNEVPAGAPGGSGLATIAIYTSTNTVCWTLSASGITLPAIASHIHKGAAGVAGPVVIPLSPPGANGTSAGCTTADAALLQDIIANPSSYYVNVHSKEFPGGAVRGQLG
jgi:CHRD domain